MRNAIVTLPDHRTEGRHRQVLRAAIGQIERAEDYVVAVANMDIPDAEVRRSTRRLRAELDELRRHLIAQSSRPPE